MKTRLINLYAFTFLVFIVTGCTTAMTDEDFDKSAISIVNLIDSRMKSNEELTKNEQDTISKFTSKYATEDQKERKSLIVTYIASLSLYYSDTIGEIDFTKRNESVSKYNDTLTLLKEQLKMKHK